MFCVSFKSLWKPFCALSLLVFSGLSFAKGEVDPTDDFRKYEGMFLTIDALLEDFAKSTTSVETPIKALFHSYSQSENFTSEFGRAVRTKILSAAASTNVSLINCSECMAYRSYVEDDQFVIEKGVSDDKRLKEILVENKTKYYAAAHIDQVGNKIVLTFTVHDFEQKKVAFSREYKTEMMVIKESGLFFTAEGGVMFIRNDTLGANNLFGAQFSFGQKVNRVGDFGIDLGVYLDAQDQVLISGGLYFGPNFNSIFDSHWSWGSLLGTLKFGVTMNTLKSSHLHFGVGAKLKIGSLFYIAPEARFYVPVKRSEDVKEQESDIMNFGNAVPFAFIIGAGVHVN